MTIAPPPPARAAPSGPGGADPNRSAGGAPPSPPTAQPAGVPELPARRRLGWRALLGCLVVVAASAATTTVFVRGQLDQLAGALSQNRSLRLDRGVLAPAGFGGPQTLLLVGNDQRAHTTTTPVLPHANEMLLVRIDPGRPWISMMSIPRELEVPIDTSSGIVDTRLNAALFYGGIQLLVSTIKQVTGLAVNHVVEIDFNNFVRAINEMGCVYSTIDRRYFHVNTPTSAQYTQVNLQPGYQRLCGSQALQFVSYRHGDTSLVRDARDQSFLLSVKQQYGPTLIDNVGKFEHIFGQTVQTDGSLHTADGVENLLGTLIASAGLPVRQVQFQANVVPPSATPCNCVTATQSQIRASIDSFLNGAGTPPKRQSAALAHSLQHHHAKPGLSLRSTPADAVAGVRSFTRRVPFAVQFPSVEENVGAETPVDLRSYRIPAPGGQTYPIYVAVFTTGLLGQYYDVQGTTWLTAPAFDNPGQSVHAGGRTYYLYYTGQHIVQIAWFDHGVAYWVRNTLTDALGNPEMLSIAEHTTPIPGAPPPASRRGSPHGSPTPVLVVSHDTSAVWRTAGTIAGLLSLFLLPAGLIALIIGRGRVTDLRARAQAAASRVAALESQLLVAEPAGGAVASLGPQTSAGGDRRSLHTSPLRRWRLALVALAVACAGAAVVVDGLGVLSRAEAKHPRRAAPRPTVPVAVLNAGSVPDEAARLGRRLERRGVRIAGVANLGATPPTGFEVLYAAGDRRQATVLARMLTSRRPAIAPIDPVAQAAAGTRAKLVIVIP